MASFNKVILCGRLTRDPEVRYTPGGTAVCDVGIVCNRSWFDKAKNCKQEEATFVDCVAFAKTAELIGEYCAKGKELLLEGRLTLDSWDDKQSGQKRSKLKVTIESVQFLGGGKSDQGQPSRQRETVPADEDEDSTPF